MYMGMDFPMVAQAGGDEHVHDWRPARGPGKYHTPHNPTALTAPYGPVRGRVGVWGGVVG